MKKRRGLADRGTSRKSRHQSTPRLERVEDRILMAVFTVTNTSDTTNATADDGSLRGEILASNATTTANTIDFSLATGAQAIVLAAPLPAITDTLFIDGTSQAGFSNAPLIQISGSTLSLSGIAGPGLEVDAAGSELLDLVIDNFDGDGVDLNGGTGLVAGCYIGTGSTGAQVAPNKGAGILVDSPNNSIGATTANPNVISGNNSGIVIDGTNATGNSVVHSYIGTNATGTTQLGNLNSTNGIGYGVEIESSNNTIGGASSNGPLGVGNLISGNYYQVLISGTPAKLNTIQGNYLGTDVTGLLNLNSNSLGGVYIQGASNNLIGGTVAGTGNVITTQAMDSIYLSGSASTLNRIQGNDIGVGSDGFTALNGGDSDIVIAGGSQNTVGGDSFAGDGTQFGNIIANSASDGIILEGGSQNGILSNSIYNIGLKSAQGIGIALDSGANQGVQPPSLAVAQSAAGETEIEGTYAGSPNTSYRIQFFSNPVANATGAGDGKNYLGDLDITTDKNGSYTFSTILQTAVPPGFFLSATATQNVLVVNNTSEFAQDIPVTLAPVSDLSVTTSVPTTGPLLSQPYTYTVTVTNNGPDDATGVVLTDTIPTKSSFVSSNDGTFSSGVLTDDIGTLVSGATVTVTITVKPIAVGSFVNTAVVTGDNLDTDSTNNTSVTTGTVAPDADLSVVLTANETIAPVGSPITYTLSVGNNGPSVANGTVVTVQFPADFTNIVVSPDQGAYTINADNSVTINTGIIPASSASMITLMASPTAVETAVTTATATSSVLDPNSANNMSSVSVTVGNAADLGVSISANPNPVLVGQDLLYTVVVTNNGPSAATAPLVLDVLPAGLTYDPTNSSAGSNGTISFGDGTVTASLGALIAGDSDTITIAVIPTTSALVSNTVTVGDPGLVNPLEIDPDLTNNTATVAVPVSPADITVTVVNPADPLFIGGNAVYQLEVTNNGPAAATNLILTDMFSGGATIVAASTGTFSGGNFNANLGTVASGQMITVSLIVDPTVSGILIDSAGVSSDEYDPDPSDNTSSSSNTVSPADISVSVAGSTSPVLLGQPVIFVVTVTNNGPATATNVLFSDEFPVGTYLGGLVSSQGSITQSGINTISGNLGSLASGAFATVTIFVAPSATLTATDSATISSDNLDPDTTNNSASFIVPVINLPGTIQADQPLVSVPENAGSITLTIDRVGGTLGTVTANYTTQDYTALAGVNYQSTSGTVTFLDGQTTATITIPILDDQKVDGSNGFFVVLSDPTGGASIGSPAVIGVVVTNTDRDLIPPTITSLLGIPNGNTISGFVLSFDKALDPTRASLLSNYFLFLSNNGSLNSGTVVPLASAQYNPVNNTVTLVPTSPVPSNHFYEIVANGTVGQAITDTSGNLLYGSSGPNSNYVAYYGQGTKLVYDDSENNVVTLNLTGGGTMGIFRASNGDAAIINLYGTVAHQSKLSGSVKKLNKKGTGHTSVGVINGFGQFGSVRSTLTTPSFYVGSAPVTASSVSAASVVPLTVSTESLTTTTTITHKKVTPKGPHHAKR